MIQLLSNRLVYTSIKVYIRVKLKRGFNSLACLNSIVNCDKLLADAHLSKFRRGKTQCSEKRLDSRFVRTEQDEWEMKEKLEKYIRAYFRETELHESDFAVNKGWVLPRGKLNFPRARAGKLLPNF